MVQSIMALWQMESWSKMKKRQSYNRQVLALASGKVWQENLGDCHQLRWPVLLIKEWSSRCNSSLRLSQLTQTLSIIKTNNSPYRPKYLPQITQSNRSCWLCQTTHPRLQVPSFPKFPPSPRLLTSSQQCFSLNSSISTWPNLIKNSSNSRTISCLCLKNKSNFCFNRSSSKNGGVIPKGTFLKT